MLSKLKDIFTAEKTLYVLFVKPERITFCGNLRASNHDIFAIVSLNYVSLYLNLRFLN